MNELKNGVDLIVILGPTASGKTKLATELAYILDGEIISADSRQVYKGMDLGTGKDLQEYTLRGTTIPYHLIDIREAGEKYNVYEFQTDFYKAFQAIKGRGKIAILCGGTGMYIEAVLRQYKLITVPSNPPLRESLSNKTLPELTDILKQYKTLHNTTETDTIKRAIRAIEIADYYSKNNEIIVDLPPINPIIFGVNIDRDIRREKTTKRLKERLDEGMIEEVKQLLKHVSADDLIYYGLEYKYLTQHAIGQLSYDEMFEQLNIAIHQFAKRQMTWFRKMEREGTQINWIDAQLAMEKKIELIAAKIGLPLQSKNE